MRCIPPNRATDDRLHPDEEGLEPSRPTGCTQPYVVVVANIKLSNASNLYMCL